MAKWTSQKYKLKMGDDYQETEGSVCGQWGIDKRDGRYILTHVPTGCFVESARTMRFLKNLVELPEFECYDGSKEATKKLAEAIGRYRNEMGWTA